MTDPAALSLRPAIIEAKAAAAVLKLGFFDHFGHEQAWVTGVGGVRVRRTSLAAIRAEWWNDPAAAGAAAESGHVVHWPFGTRAADAPVSGLLRDVGNLLEGLGPDVGCLLDRFRRADTPAYHWAILGPAASEVRAHRDMYGTASWNLLLTGRKTWSVWDVERTPAIDEPTLRFEQEPGSLVWLPEDWWHRVTYAAPSLCVSKNLVPARSLEAIRARLGDAEPALARHLAAMSGMPRRRLGP